MSDTALTKISAEFREAEVELDTAMQELHMAMARQARAQQAYKSAKGRLAYATRMECEAIAKGGQQ